MKQKQKKTKTKKSPPTKESIGKALNLKQDLFCQYFVKNSETRGNATLSYAEAYGYDLDSMSRENEIVKEWDEKTESFIEREKLGSSERAMAEDVCATNGKYLLRNTQVQDRITKLYNELLRDDVVDRELAKVILQDEKLEPKVSGIREYNKLKKRVTDLIEVKRPLEEMTDEELAAVQREARKMLTKK